MGQISRRREDDPRFDADLARLVETTGRAPIGASVVCFVGAGLIWGIGKAAGLAATVFDYGAALIIGVVVAPALLLMGRDHRARTLDYARREQVERDERRSLPRPRRPTTSKHATLRQTKTPKDTEDGPL